MYFTQITLYKYNFSGSYYLEKVRGGVLLALLTVVLFTRMTITEETKTLIKGLHYIL